MTRGFEHRLWGYRVVKIKQRDPERGIVSHSSPSVRAPSPTASLTDQQNGEYRSVSIGESSVKDGPVHDDEGFDRRDGGHGEFGNGEPTIRPVPESRERSREMEEGEGEGEWQIPETVILTSESISPF